MVWIKRNLLFVISVAVGLLLTGYCGYLLYSTLNDNAGLDDSYKSALSSLQQMQLKTPFPSKENIEAVAADQEHVREFLAEFRKRFAPLPAPPVAGQKGFETYLEDSLVQFRARATNAGVELPAGFGFAFSSLIGKFNYPPNNIAPWMQQLQEISAILDILCKAKINSLSSLQRVPVSQDDNGINDCLQAATVTNQWGTVTPYKITFGGFSTEIAAVLEGFAKASNCFIVKSIAVTADKSLRPTMAQPAVRQQMPLYQPPPQISSTMQNGLRGEGAIRTERQAPAPRFAAPGVSGPSGMASAPPVVILSENPLVITLRVDLVKLKESEQ